VLSLPRLRWEGARGRAAARHPGGGAEENKDGTAPIVPGKPEASEIIERIFATDKDEIMPPPKAHKELTPVQKELIKRWVAEGAEYEAHWAYAPLVRPAVPGGREGASD